MVVEDEREDHFFLRKEIQRTEFEGSGVARLLKNQ
jgi:hypothetical protein